MYWQGMRCAPRLVYSSRGVSIFVEFSFDIAMKRVHFFKTCLSRSARSPGILST